MHRNLAWIAGGQEAALGPAAVHVWMALEVVGKRLCHEVRLRIDRDSLSQSLLEDLEHQRIMGTAKDRRLRLGHLAFQRLDVAAHQRLGEDHVTLFDGIDETATGLRLDVDADGAEGQLALEGTGAHRGRRGKERDVLHRDLARRRVVAPLPLGQRLDQRHEDPQDALALGQAALLHPAQRRRRGGVAGEDHQIAARVPEAVHRIDGQFIDVIRVAHAVGRVPVVAVVDQRHLGQPLCDRVENREPAKPGIKHTNRHSLPSLPGRTPGLPHVTPRRLTWRKPRRPVLRRFGMEIHCALWRRPRPREDTGRGGAAPGPRGYLALQERRETSAPIRQP